VGDLVDDEDADGLGVEDRATRRELDVPAARAGVPVGRAAVIAQDEGQAIARHRDGQVVGRASRVDDVGSDRGAKQVCRASPCGIVHRSREGSPPLHRDSRRHNYAQGGKGVLKFR